MSVLMQGGFAKCYEITSLDTKKVYAAKIIEKSSLNRSKAKEKVPRIPFSSPPKSRFTSRSITLILFGSSTALRTLNVYTYSWKYVLTKLSTS